MTNPVAYSVDGNGNWHVEVGLNPDALVVTPLGPNTYAVGNIPTTDKGPIYVVGVGDMEWKSTAYALVVYGKSNILGTVSQASGIPTGAIIEKGSNANGQYIKFADGTMICSNANKVAAQTVSTATGYIYTSVQDEYWPYPAAFIALPSLAFHVIGSVNFTWVGASQSYSPGATGAYFRAFSSVVIGTGPTFSCIAIGRWY